MMQYAIFARPVVTIYDLPQTTKQSEAGLVSTIGDEGLYGQACQVRTAPGGVTAEGVPLSPEVAEVVTFYGYHGFVRWDALKFVSEDALRDYLAQPVWASASSDGSGRRQSRQPRSSSSIRTPCTLGRLRTSVARPTRTRSAPRYSHSSSSRTNCNSR